MELIAAFFAGAASMLAFAMVVGYVRRARELREYANRAKRRLFDIERDYVSRRHRRGDDVLGLYRQIGCD